MAVLDISSPSITDLISLQGRRALVTGAARGIGLAVARRLAEASADVALADLDGAAADREAAVLDRGEGRALGLRLDVTDPASIRAAVTRATEAFGGIDILINNAGIFPIAPVLAGCARVWDLVIATNLSGAFHCSVAAAERMAEQGSGGVIVNMCSTQSLKAGGPGLAAYTASKHGLVGLTQSLAIELGPLGIRVLGVAPTLVDTPGLAEKQPIFEAAGLGDIIARTAAALPLGRVCTPDDVARVVLFAVSDLASVMTGSLLLADAGAMVL